MALNVDVTLRRLAYELKKWADAHEMLSDFLGYGQFLQTMQEGERLYPVMVVNATSAPSENFYINYSMEVMCLEWVDDEQSNRSRAMSDMRQILNDLEETIKYSNRWQAFAKIDGQVQCVPATEIGADKAFGWIATFTIKIKKRHGICNIQAVMPEYDFETGTILGPQCLPATYKNSDNSFSQSIASGETYTAPDVTITINGTPYTLAANKDGTFTVTGSPAGNSLNGATLTPIVGGTTKNFIIKDLDGDPVTVTQISDSASEFVGEVDTNIPVLYPQRGPYTMDESFYTGDEGYYRIDGRYDGHLSNQLPSNAIIQQLDDEIDTVVISNGYNIQRQRFYTILHDDSAITGMNHKHRFVSPYTGDYFDYSDTTNQSWFKDKDGNIIDRNDWCVHPDYPTLQYFVDRLTMIGYIRGPQGSNFDAVATTYIQKLAAVVSLNLMGKTDWMIQNKGESEKFLINHIYSPFSDAQTPFAWDAPTLGAQPYYYLASCTLGYTTSDRFWYIGTIYASGNISTSSALYSSYQRYHENNDWTWND